MITYKPVPLKMGLGQAQALAPVPPPPPDFLFTGYTGVPGFLEALAVLAIAGSAAWIGITTGMQRNLGDYRRAAGWVGGVGSALIGLLYLGAKSGISQQIGIPAVRVSPN